ncbi:hormogonium polysaccharide biosynthesis protein HpsA [Lyngbya aestuarii]|uniref:hormogonium polysaccharide biosynthesis protein HpsA n=1 Tax=Lyngbya aestuarii TaxID=118322 RepID=UPI00403D6D43
MSTRKRKSRLIDNLLRQIGRLSRAITKAVMTWLLRSLMILGRRSSRYSTAGFVLPTVVMVTLVVVLLTTAILIRSFDRAKNASNYRVNETVLRAAEPAIDRARAKLDALFNDPTLPRSTPSEAALNDALQSPRYRFGDEEALTVAYDSDQSDNSAWRFPVDTDNNGKFDSYTLYGLFFRSPSRNLNTGQFDRARRPLDARTPPMDSGAVGGVCAATQATTANFVGNSSWYKQGGELKKSFFTIVATVPITEPQTDANYETYKGNQGFSALEYQQDRALIPLSNNAVWFDDDIDIGNLPTFRLNGRVFTNSNLLVSSPKGNPDTDSNPEVIFYQVSSPDSCYYLEENAEIIVGGNVAAGATTQDKDTQGPVKVHRFLGAGVNPMNNGGDDNIDGNNKTITENGGQEVAYNTLAYAQRIEAMVNEALDLHTPGLSARPDPLPVIDKASVSGVARYPQEVKDNFEIRFDEGNKDPIDILTEELQTYFQDRTRRVPFAEVPFGGDPLGDLGNTLGVTTPIRPPEDWMNIDKNNLNLKFDNQTLFLPAVDPNLLQGIEELVGDRVSFGNGLPARWYEGNENFADPGDTQPVTNNGNEIFWNNQRNGGADQGNPRTRESLIEPVPDLGKSERNGFWEVESAKQPQALENTGGFRVITGAGIYVTDDGNTNNPSFRRSDNSFLPNPRLLPGLTPPFADAIVTWPDSLPMTGSLGENRKGDLQMRATAVYHYTSASGTAQQPIACVSSYYDPTNPTTARNPNTLPDVSGGIDTTGNDGTIDVLANGSNPGTQPTALQGARSNNGVSYSPPTSRTLYATELAQQARLVYPNGRLVNEPLRKALAKTATNRTLADNSAIDSAICALGIMDGSLAPNASVVPHGAIKEVAFLNAREVKSINSFDPDAAAAGTALDPLREAETIADLKALANNTDETVEADLGTAAIPIITDTAPTSYTLPLEQRQPLESRVTELDLNLLKNRNIGSEFLIPNSGIIYASRDDALPDRSNATQTDGSDGTADVSAVDFQLDPTRRPDGIRLINGSEINRTNSDQEKGLILATDLPVYIKGDFNRHDHEEFTTRLDDDWGNFYTRDITTLDPDFACRPNLRGCGPQGDKWRPATILADSVTLLSDNFRDGFRNEGDYDLRNNIGNLAVDSRLKNGFWFNNFVTSANDWVAPNGFPKNDLPDPDRKSYLNSYLTNGVTPVQRREQFPEYVMEVCLKLPLSQCGPTDWVVGYDVDGDNNFYQDTDGDGIIQDGEYDVIPALGNIREIDVKGYQLGQAVLASGVALDIARLAAGTTAKAAWSDDLDGSVLTDADYENLQRFPRRVAFARNDRGLVVLDTTANNTPKPLGIGCPLDNTGAAFAANGCTYPTNGRGNAETNYGTPQANALWFATTNITGGNFIREYRAGAPLYYLEDLETDPTPTENQVLLPGITEVPGIPALAGLNGTTENDASDYAVCTATSSSKAYQGAPAGPDCDATAIEKIEAARLALSALPADWGATSDAWGGNANNQPRLDATTNPIAGYRRVRDDNKDGVYVYDLPDAGGATNIGPAVITLRGTQETIFVLKAPGANSIKFTGGAVELKLEGIDPNNVFWVSGGNITFDGSPHKLAGNFIGSPGGTLVVGAGTEISGGRFLGFASVTGSIPATFTAMTTTQPQLLPILQIHSPEGKPDNDPDVAFNGLMDTNWIPKAIATTFNGVFVTGDFPSKPNEPGGGLGNFMRFLEDWVDTGNPGNPDHTARISGSFIQTRKSNFSVAPFVATNPGLDENNLDTSLFYDEEAGTGKPTYYDDGFKYRGGASQRRSPYYLAPKRNWGFDVGLLTQLPDLFSERFTQPPAGEPFEFFREIGRDDEWVQTLLCAKDANNNPVLTDQRPDQFCTANTGG